MTYPRFDFDDYEANQDPRRIQAADQMYAEADLILTQVLAGIREIEPSIYKHANHDASVLFDYLKSFINRAHTIGGERSEAVTLVVCAAALTKLARAPRVESNPLAHLEDEGD